ncbi:centromere-associated protein E [Discoglossus pictus]
MSESDAVKVCVRVRPLIQREHGEQAHLLWKAENASISQVDGTKTFNFDRVFHSHETTCQVYQEIAVPIIRAALQGYNGTIFAYGQTSSGKTYTMMGTSASLGIIPQAVQEVFKFIQEVPGREFLLRVSYMEIYNETVTDLLCDDRKKKPLEIREDINRNVYVADLTEEVVVVPEQVITWIKKGEKNRHYGETKMNEHSSRSHTIFRMIVESRERNDPGNAENCEGAVMVSHLNLVDLAGSERASQTGAEGMRLKEGCNINRSLFILGQVIKKLSDGQVGGFINYRDSKLTRILQNSLGGNAKTLIICTVTPVSFDETLSTLQFASTAKHVRNTPHVNEVLDDQALLKRYRKEIMDLKKQLEELEASSEVRAQAMAKEEYSQLFAEISLLQKEREERIWNLTNIVVPSSQASSEEQRVKRKRRVTWAPGNIKKSLCSADGSGFNISTIVPNFSKKAKFSELAPLSEIDDSTSTEFDFGESSNAFEELAQELDLNNVNLGNRRENALLCQSMIDFTSSEGQVYNGNQFQESSLQKSKEMEQKAVELENQLKKVISENEAEAEVRESLKKEIASLQMQLQTKEEQEKNFELRIKDLVVQLQAKTEANEMSSVLQDNSVKDQRQVENEVLEEGVNVLRDPVNTTDNREVEEQAVDEKVQSSPPDDWVEHKKMLELRILDLEEMIATIKSSQDDHKTENYNEQDFRESVQLCEVLMTEKGNAVEELAAVRKNFDGIILENETLKREIADLGIQLKEKDETEQFEKLEIESLKEHEAQLTHEITSLKKTVQSAEVYNEDLETLLESKSKLIEDQEKKIKELQKHADELQRKARNMELAVSMGNSERLCEEVFQMKQSLSDAEGVTLDAQKESAFLRSENLQLKDKMEELSIRYNQMETDVSTYEKQLETERAKYKKMQTDLQKELQYAFGEINQLNALMIGKVPKDLLSRVELDKKIADCTKQLEKALEEKNHLEQEVNETSEELSEIKVEREQSATVLSNQETRLQEQTKQIEKLIEDLTQAHEKFQEAEERYLELKNLHDCLCEKCTLISEELTQKQREAEILLKEVEQLKGQVETLEEKLSANIQEVEETISAKEQLLLEREQLIQDKQMVVSNTEQLDEQLKIIKCALSTVEGERNQLNIELQALKEEVTALTKEREELQESLEEKDHLQEQLSSLVEDLQNQVTNPPPLQKEKEDNCQQNLLHEMEHLQDSLKEMQCSLEIMQLEKLEVTQKLQELQEELNVITNEKHELQHILEDLKNERDSLKQDLNENIELSIETQDELRTAQEEIKQQTQIINGLNKRIAEYAESTSLETENKKDMVVEEKIQPLTDELNIDSEKSMLKDEDGKILHLHQKILTATKEKEELQGILETVRAERDQLKLDLQENIEMSIETQEELRCALDELNQKKQLLDEKKTVDLTFVSAEDLEHKICQLEEQLGLMTSEREKLVFELKNMTDEKHELEELVSTFMGRDSNTEICKNNLQEELQCTEEVNKRCELYEAQLQEERIKNINLQNQMEEQENQLNNIFENIREANSKYETAMETLESVTREKDQLLLTLKSSTAASDTITIESTLYRQVKEVNDQILQTSFEIDMQEYAEERISDSSTRLGNIEVGQSLNNEKCNQLQQQLLLISQEKDELQQLIDHFKQENNHLIMMTDQLKNTEREAMLTIEDQFNTSQEALVNEIEKLKEELKMTESKLDLKETESVEKEQNCILSNVTQVACDEIKQVTFDPSMETEPSQQSYTSEIKLLEENLQVTQALLETIQGEKIELETKLHSLQEEVLHLKNEQDQKNLGGQQLVEEHDQVQLDLKSKVDEHPETMKHSESMLEALQGEKYDFQQKLLALQHQVEMVTLERDELKNTQDRLIAENDKLEEDLKVNFSKCTEIEDELRRTQEEVKCQKELMDDLKNQDTSRPNSEIVQSLEEKILCFRNELEQKTSNEQQLIDKQEQVQYELQSKVDVLMETMKHSESMLDGLQAEKSEAQQKLLDLQQQMEMVTQERDDMKNEHTRLIAECVQLKENQQEHILKYTEIQDKLKRTQEDLQCQKDLADDLKNQDSSRATPEIVQSLEEKVLHLKNELEQKVVEEQQIIDEHVQVQYELKSKVNALMETMKHSESILEALQGEKLMAEQKLLDLQQQMETVTQEREELKNTQDRLIAESDQLKEDLKESISKYVQIQDQLKSTHDELKYQKDLMDDLRMQVSSRPTTEIVQSLEEKMLHLREELHQKNAEEQQLINKHAQAQGELKAKVDELNETMKSTQSILEALQGEKTDAEQKLCDLQLQMETVTQERAELQNTKGRLVAENDQLKEDLKENVSMMLHLREELHQKNAEEQQLINKHAQAQSELKAKVDELNEAMKSTQSILDALQGEKTDAEQKLCDLQHQMETVTQERAELQNTKGRLVAENDQLKEDLKENVSMFIEIQAELRKAQEELQLQKPREQDLNNQISMLEQKFSSQEEEVLRIETTLKETIQAKEILTECKQQLAAELEQLNQSLKNKDIVFEQLENEKMEDAKKLLNVTKDMRTVSEERDELKNVNETLQDKATKLQNELQQLHCQHDILCDEHQKGKNRLEEMETENKQLKESILASDASIQQLEAEKVLFEKQIQEHEKKVSSLHQEREQFQQLLERIRTEKDNIYSDLQAQENISMQLREELKDCRNELQSIKQQKNAINESIDKANKLDDQLASLQQKLQQVNEELVNEKVQNCDLCMKVELMEKEIEILRSIQDESLQEEDPADRMEILENKNQELKELMGKIADTYSDHQSLLSDISGDVQNNIEEQKQAMSTIKEYMSSTMSRAFGNLQAENGKINCQLLTLLSKFKVLCRNTTFNEENYNLIKEYESDLCNEQKKLDELQYVEEHGIKFSSTALQDLKICELEFLNKLIFKKAELIKRVEGDFSERQAILGSIASELQEEVKCKKEFLLWHEEFKSLDIDATKLHEGVQKENRRIAGVIQLLAKKMKAFAQLKASHEITAYKNQLDMDLREKSEKNRELIARMKHISPSGNTSILEEENAALLTKLKSVEAELKKTQSRIRTLENELDSAKTGMQQKEDKVAVLQSRLLSKTAESELAKIQVKVTEKENALQTALQEIQALQEKVAKGASPYKDEIDNLKTQLVKIEMEKMKLSKSMDREIESLKACIEDKTESVRKLKEQLRRTQQDHDSTVVLEKDHSNSSKIPLTCGGGSGIVQSTAMLVLQSEKATLERELLQYKKKCERLSKNLSHLEEELTKWKARAIRAQTSPSKSETFVHRTGSPNKAELPRKRPGSPNMIELHRKRPTSPSKMELQKKCPLSPSKAELHRKRAVSAYTTEIQKQTAQSPRKTDIPLLSSLTASPNKNKDLQGLLDSPKSTFFDTRSRSLPVQYPTQFFDNSSLGTFSETKTAETSEKNEEEWWNAPNKGENAAGCKPS